jgi:serine/threonine protein kinase
LKAQIIAKMGMSQNASIRALSGKCGGLNDGMWIAEDVPSRTALVLKLAPSRPRHGGASEAENFVRISREHPSIVNDTSIAFPLKVCSCIGPAGDHPHDLIVMRKASGEPLGDVIALKRNAGGMPEVLQILRQLGMFLAQFHKRYGNKQHGDFQPSNIFYDSSSRMFALIDIADLGHRSAVDGDVPHFIESLRILSSVYGQQFYSEGKRHFEEGYMMGRQASL